MDEFLPRIAHYINGEIQAIYTWENGDFTGVVIKDGVYYKCKVTQVLELPKELEGRV
jgi:hypothetical protein